MNFLERLYDRCVGQHVFGKRVLTLAGYLAEMIPPNMRLLDVGCGNGLLAHTIQKQRPDLEIRGIEVLVPSQTFIPIEKYDGRTIPFPDGSFDGVMFIDVLHHTDDPLSVLREGARVARQAIFIKDHPADAFLGKPTLRFMDWVANARHGIALPYNYWARPQWDTAFATLGLTIKVWKPKLGLYRPAGWLFGRGLHFLAHLELPARTAAPALSKEHQGSTNSQ